MGKRRRDGNGDSDAVLAELARCVPLFAFSFTLLTLTSVLVPLASSRGGHAPPQLAVGLASVSRALQQRPPPLLAAVSVSDPSPLVGHLQLAAAAAGVPLVLVRGRGAGGSAALGAACGVARTALAVGIRASAPSSAGGEEDTGEDVLFALAAWLRRHAAGSRAPGAGARRAAPADTLLGQPTEFMS